MATLYALKSIKKLVLSQEWTDEEDVHVKLHLGYFLLFRDVIFGLQYRAVKMNDLFWPTPMTPYEIQISKTHRSLKTLPASSY